MKQCPVCLNQSFSQVDVLKKRLIDEWELTPIEVEYINKQQGLSCDKCKSNLRSMTLADAIMRHYSYNGSFQDFFKTGKPKNLKVLEINEAGNLHSFFLQAKEYTFAEYPVVDIHQMPYTDNIFDMIVHSDTLEHVKNSRLALKECYRVLKEGGVMFYTIPIVYGKLTRRRDNLPDSFHGSQEESQGNDYKVWTEYGADFWVELINTGFKEIRLHSIENLTSLAITACKNQNFRKKLRSFGIIIYDTNSTINMLIHNKIRKSKKFVKKQLVSLGLRK